jgi:hypothetical protein
MLEAWGAKTKNRTFTETSGFLGLAAEGGKAKHQLSSGKRVVVWPWHPRPPTNHLAQKPLRDPSDFGVGSKLL